MRILKWFKNKDQDSLKYRNMQQTKLLTKSMRKIAQRWRAEKIKRDKEQNRSF